MLRMSLSKKYRRLMVAILLALLFFGLVAAVRHILYPARPVKVIGYACDGGCGGLADRQKGIVASFVLAAMLGKVFKIYMTHPCPLTYFLLPRTFDLDWRLEPGELNQVQVTRLNFMNHRAVDWAEDLVSQDVDLEAVFRGEFVFLTTNMEIVHILRQHRLARGIHWLQKQTIPEIYRTVLTQLFAFMPWLQQKWDHFRQSFPANTKLICAQIRVGGSGDTESFNTLRDIDGLATFLAPYNSSSSSPPGHHPYRLLFTSDKAFMLQHVHRLFPDPSLHVQIAGPVTHVDRSVGNDVCPGMARVLVEQRALSTCDVLVMSESGLARVAAFLRGTDHQLFLFHDGRVERTTQESPFPNRPSW